MHELPCNDSSEIVVVSLDLYSGESLGDGLETGDESDNSMLSMRHSPWVCN